MNANLYTIFIYANFFVFFFINLLFRVLNDIINLKLEGCCQIFKCILISRALSLIYQ